MAGIGLAEAGIALGELGAEFIKGDGDEEDGFFGGIERTLEDIKNGISNFGHAVVDETGMVTGEMVGGVEGFFWGLFLDIIEPFKDIFLIFGNLFQVGVVLLLLYYVIVI